jgi:hypothetical protein
MTIALPFSGGCACGSIRYECSVPPITSANCHCRDCQRASGSAFGAFLVVPADGFRVTHGEPKFFRKLSDGGDPMLRGFCTECGSPVLLREEHRPKLEFIHVASLDDPSWYRPTMDIFTSSAQPWDLMNPELDKHPRMPPIPKTLGR